MCRSYRLKMSDTQFLNTRLTSPSIDMSRPFRDLKCFLKAKLRKSEFVLLS